MALITLTTDQVTDLRDGLVECFPSNAKMEELMMGLDRSFALLAHDGKNLPENVMIAVRNAEAQDWVVELVDAAHGAVRDEPRFDVLKRQLAYLAPPPGVDHFKVCRLTGDNTMVDRKALREALRGMHGLLGKRILVVTGPPRSGKTHTLQYISYLREVLDTFRFVFVDLEAYPHRLGTPKLIEPIDIAQTLVTKLGYDMRVPERPADMQWANWILEFCDAFEPYAVDDPHRRWIVMDAFDKVVMSQNTLDLVQQLAARIGQSLGRHRLVLLGYEGHLPATLTPHVEHQHIEPIQLRDLLEFFVLAHEQHRISCDEGRVTAAVLRVVGDLDPRDADFLGEIGPRLSHELATLAGATP